MRICVAVVKSPFIRGGAEILVENLKQQLVQEGHLVEEVSIPFIDSPPRRLADMIQGCRLLSISERSVDLVIGTKFPAYCIKHPVKNLWVFHQHRQAYDLWDTDLSDIRGRPEGDSIKRLILEADNESFLGARKIYTISKNVSSRLLKYNGVLAPHLYPPLAQRELYCPGAYGDYIFYPSRINPTKRQFLALQAAALTQTPVKILFAGAWENIKTREIYKQFIASNNLAGRVRFLGYVSDQEKMELYSNSLAVLFTPLDEDYGYVTLEAGYSGKAVITCSDSGAPLEFIDNGVNGLVTRPHPADLAVAMDTL
ncbi:MAG: glycosyltransferase family 4 protein, partial [Desulfocucumaceae bacterium]